MGWTQWLIFVSLLTLMTFEYWPWNKLKKQPWIRVGALVGCAILGYLMMVVAGMMIAAVLPPIMGVLQISYPDPSSIQFLVGVGYMNVALADWLIAAVIAVSIFFDNWPKGFSQKKNLLFRFIIVLVLGLLMFVLYYPLSNFLLTGLGNPFYDSPTPFMLLFLWIELVFAYLWRKWPIYTAME